MSELIILAVCAVLSIVAGLYQVRRAGEDSPELVAAEQWWWNIPM